MGYDSDHAQSEGEVGKCGVAIDSLEDMEILFDGIDLEKITTSMTINSPASILWAMYLVVAEKQGADWKKISGTIQNDILKEYIAQKEYIYPPAPSMRLVVDTFEFGARATPKFNTISISGYHIREAGSTALQELAFTLYDGVEYVEWARRRGLDVDEFGPRLSFFFNAHNDFFEEIAKYRAARKIWHQTMKERFGAKNQRTWLLRFHTQTAGVSLPAQQPMNNIARVAVQALAAVLGGTQSLHTDSYDEALALPTADAARIALRTQQIIAHESGVAQTVDPLGGSYFLERLTLDMENGAFDHFGKLDAMGGMVKAIERGYPQKEIAEASYQYQRAIEAREKVIVGVNEFVIEEESPKILYIDESVARHQEKKLKALRARRSNEEVTRRLYALKKAAAQEPTLRANGGISEANTMPYIIDAVRAYATVGEICAALRDVYGTYTEVSVT
jgi:methylmalonyl-CoA mutase N-terminal domain/subunit